MTTDDANYRRDATKALFARIAEADPATLAAMQADLTQHRDDMIREADLADDHARAYTAGYAAAIDQIRQILADAQRNHPDNA